MHSSMTGIITSPNYPNKYPNNANCRYLIRNSNPRARITINFLAFRLESSCIYDRIKIYDGESTSANQLGSLNGYCGTSLQNRIFKSSGNALLITFTTDGSVTFSGFQISYRGKQKE